MRSQLKNRLERIQQRGEDGFTLIELLVVLLIIGILLGIAIPTFLTVTQSASNTATQSNLQTAVTAADAYYTQNNGSYGTFADGSLTTQDTSLTFVGAADTTAYSDGAKTISWYQPASTTNDIVFAAWSPGTNRCYVVADVKDSTMPSGTADTFTNNVAYGYVTLSGGDSGCTASAMFASSTGVPASTTTGDGPWTTSGFPK